MGRLPILQEQTTNSHVAEFMYEFARYLVAAGITTARFSEIARQAYFRAASRNARFRSNRVNQSAVAAMTGLTRLQVRSYAKAEQSKGRSKPDRIQNIISGWNSDPAFTTSNFLPRRLSLGAKNSSFSQLVRKYGGDLPARSILREMVRNDLVTQKGSLVYLNRRARETSSQVRLQDMSRLLSQLMSRSSPSPKHVSPLRAMVKEVAFPSTSSKGHALLQKKTAEILQAFALELKVAGDAASIETPTGHSVTRKVTRSRVIVLTEDLDSVSSEENESE